MYVKAANLLLLGASVAACGGGGGGSDPPPPPPPPPASFTVGGTVTGLSGTGLVLQNNGAADLTIDADGAFTFAGTSNANATYNVTVATQPTASPAEICAVSNGTGTVLGSVTNISVACRAMTGRFVYVPNIDSDDISIYAIEPSTGALSAAANSPFSVAVDSPRTVAIDPAERFLYVIGSTSFPSGPASIAGYSLDSMTGELTAIPSMAVIDLPSAVVSPVTFHPNGRLLFVPVGFPPSTEAGLYVYTIDQTTGALAAAGPPHPFPGNGVPRQPKLDKDGQLLHVAHSYSGQNPAITQFAVDTTTGVLTQTSSTTLNTSVNEIVLNPAGTHMHTRISNSTSPNLIFGVDPTTGALTTPVDGPTGVGSGVLFSRTGEFAYYPMLDVTPPRPFPYGPSSLRAYAVNGAALTELSSSPQETSSGQAIAYAIDPTETYIVASQVQGPAITVLKMDRATGELSQVPGSPFTGVGTSGAVTFDRSGRYAYATDVGSPNAPSTNTISAYGIDPATGAPTLIGSYPTGDGPSFFPRIVGVQ